jgi:NAD(P)-dependent dehydrogenase (short-subunit alcohol dehydrogenase family)
MRSQGRKLAGQVALITGASSGIGRAMALALGAVGAKLCVVGRNTRQLEEVVAAAGDAAAAAVVFPADLSREEEIQRLARSVHQEVGAVDLLIHSAGAPVEELDRQYQVNVRAPFLLTQLLLPALVERRGQIVFINSSVGLRGKAGVTQYSATKHALKALADGLRDEVNASGVRIMSVFPGRTATPMQAVLLEQEGREYHPDRLLQPEDVATVVIQALMLPETAEVTDLQVRPFLK